MLEARVVPRSLEMSMKSDKVEARSKEARIARGSREIPGEWLFALSIPFGQPGGPVIVPFHPTIDDSKPLVRDAEEQVKFRFNLY
jgi:hypothetical protein